LEIIGHGNPDNNFESLCTCNKRVYLGTDRKCAEHTYNYSYSCNSDRIILRGSKI